MLNVREIYKNPSQEHYRAWFLAGICTATTSSVFLLAAGKAWYAIVAAPLLVWLSMICAGRARKNYIRLKSRSAIVFNVLNLFVLLVLVLLSW